MKQSICKFLLFRLLGWKSHVTIAYPDKCILAVAPHTTNWDLFLGKLYYGTMGREASFMMKKEWFFFPLGAIFRWMGGIPVYRGKKTSLVDQMVERFKKSTKFHLAITPEGTRKANPDWKKGFYYIALKAQVPIVLIGIDYPSKTITCTKSFVPTGDIEKEMREVKLYFKDFRGKKPGHFTVGNID